ncbi:MAG: hypothetical protein MPN21_22000 [Thermoanaerobaculia bacterium]|nr:hypothetical protein [Thermoanaerobaculia bacterium]
MSPTSTLSRDPYVKAPPFWRRSASVAGCIFLGAVLLVAAWSKSLDPLAFGEEVRAQGLDFLLSGEIVALLALALEYFLGTALLLAIRRRWVLWPSAALVAFFVFLTGRTWYLDAKGLLPEAAGCGCFGNLVQRTPAEAFWQDLLLMVPALALAFLTVERGGRPLVRLVLVGLATVAGTAFAWKAPELPLDDFATRLKPGVEIDQFCAGSSEEGMQVCMNAILPETQGRHLVVMTDLENKEFLGDMESLNELVWSGAGPRLWVLSSAEAEERFQFQFSHGATFEVLETPAPLMSPLYRTLPRSFLMEDGKVLETWSGMPPVKNFLAETETPKTSDQ